MGHRSVRRGGPGRTGAAAERLRGELIAYDHRAAQVDRAGFVVTHGELKPGNLLTTPDGIALVDWDTALLAPRERNLWRLDATDDTETAWRVLRDLLAARSANPPVRLRH